MKYVLRNEQRWIFGDFLNDPFRLLFFSVSLVVRIEFRAIGQEEKRKKFVEQITRAWRHRWLLANRRVHLLRLCNKLAANSKFNCTVEYSRSNAVRAHVETRKLSPYIEYRFACDDYEENRHFSIVVITVLLCRFEIPNCAYDTD